MLILAFLTFCSFLIDVIFDMIFALLPFATVPSSITNLVTAFFDVLALGLDMFGFLIGPVGKLLLRIVIDLEAFHALYKFIWFIIRKIPILNIRE